MQNRADDNPRPPSPTKKGLKGGKESIGNEATTDLGDDVASSSTVSRDTPSSHASLVSQSDHRERQEFIATSPHRGNLKVDLKSRPSDPFVPFSSPNLPRRTLSPPLRPQTAPNHHRKPKISASVVSQARPGERITQDDRSGLIGPPPQLAHFRTTPLKHIRKTWREKEGQYEVPPAFKHVGGSTKGAAPSEQPNPKGGLVSRVRRRSSGLPVDLIVLGNDAGDTNNVDTYNRYLSNIVHDVSSNKAQMALNVLATMGRHGVAPNSTTWSFVEQCSDIGKDDALEGSSRIEEETQPEKLTVYEDHSSTTASTHSDIPKSGRKRWKMEQDLSLLPPAFRASILAMLRLRGKGEPIREDDLLPLDSSKSTRKVRDMASPPISDGENSEKDLRDNSVQTLESSAHGKAQDVLPDTSFSSPARKDKRRQPPKVNDEPPTTRDDSAGSAPDAEHAVDKIRDETFAKHGIHRYMRPDGFGDASRTKLGITSKEKASVDESHANHDDLGVEGNNKLLMSIAKSDLPDKAKRAGDVLKGMKENNVKPNEVTRLLLERCSGVEPVQDFTEPIPLPPGDEDYVTPTGVVRKRVTFSDTIQTRIIRRRRSISAVERWDDPLTPPKRVSGMVDLAPGRFSTDLRDNRPSLPKRCDSMSSLMSAGSDTSIQSDRSDRTFESSEDGSSLDSPKANVPTFKLPFDESPKVNVAKTATGGKPPQIPNRSSATSEKSNASEVHTTPPRRPRLRRRTSISGTIEYRDAPLTPPRRVSAPLDFLVSGLHNKESGAKIAVSGRVNRFERFEDKMPFPSPKRQLPLETAAVCPKGQSKEESIQTTEVKIAQPTSVPLEAPLFKPGSDHGPPRPTKKGPPQLSNSDHCIPQPREATSSAGGGTVEPHTSSLDRHHHVVADHWRILNLPQKGRHKQNKFSKVSSDSFPPLPKPVGSRRAARLSRSSSLGTGKPNHPADHTDPQPSWVKIKAKETTPKGGAIKKGTSKGPKPTKLNAAAGSSTGGAEVDLNLKGVLDKKKSPQEQDAGASRRASR